MNLHEQGFVILDGAIPDTTLQELRHTQSDPDNIFDHADIKEALETFWIEDNRE